MRDKEKLMAELEFNAQNAGAPLERRLADYAHWYTKNMDDIPKDNLVARMSFLDLSTRISIEIMALLLERITVLEAGRAPQGTALWLPKELHVNGM